MGRRQAAPPFERLNRVHLPALDWPALLGGVTCPVLLLTADPERGALTTAAQAAALAARLTRAGPVRVEHFPGAGHNIRRERYELYLEAVRAFL